MPTTIPSLNATLEVKVVFDISGTSPVIKLTNQSVGDQEQSPVPLLDTLTWVLNIFSPTGTPIYTSSFDTPFKYGDWATATIVNDFPRPFGQIEWSGADYIVAFEVYDADGNVYNLDKSAAICRPTGNTKQSTDTYGQATLQVQANCDMASLYIVDATSKTYKGLTGASLSSYLVVDYPRDATGTLPPAFEISGFTADALVPFSYNGKGYKASYYTVWEYDLGDNVFVDIRYVANTLFDVACNIDLCPLACEIDALIDQIETGRCSDIEAAKDKLFRINAKFNLAVIAKFNPSCGLDLGTLVQEIKDIGGFSCDCTNATTGIGAQSALISGVLYQVNAGGDITGSFTQTGNNVSLNIQDKTYSFSICSDSETNAFKFRPTTNGNTTNVCLYVKKSTLANELLNTIKNDTDLTNLFNSIVMNSGGLLVNVDGKCILQSNNLTSYVWNAVGIPPSPNIATAVSIKNGEIVVPINFAFNSDTYTALQTKLNSLGLGTFVVQDNTGGTVSITSASNSHTLSNLTYNVGSGNQVATMVSSSSGVQQYSVEQVLQEIINYLSPIDEANISLSKDYSVPAISTQGGLSAIGVAASENCGENTTLENLIEAQIAAQGTVVDYVLKLKGADCDSLKELFKQSAAPIDANTLLYGSKNGGCAGMLPLSAFQYMLSAGIKDAATKKLFCDFVASCGAGLSCEVISFNLVVSPYDTSCPSIAGIIGQWV